MVGESKSLLVRIEIWSLRYNLAQNQLRLMWMLQASNAAGNFQFDSNIQEMRGILGLLLDQYKQVREYTIIICSYLKMIESPSRHKNLPVVIVRNRSWPAVSQICSFIRLPSSSMVLILKSMLHSQQGQKQLPQKRTLITASLTRCQTVRTQWQ